MSTERVEYPRCSAPSRLNSAAFGENSGCAHETTSTVGEAPSAVSSTYVRARLIEFGHIRPKDGVPTPVRCDHGAVLRLRPLIWAHEVATALRPFREDPR